MVRADRWLAYPLLDGVIIGHSDYQASYQTLVKEIAAWEKKRNEQQATIDWRFSVEDAREKMKRLYPSLPT